MALLREKGESYGLQLVEQAGGQLSRGGIYVILGRMEEKGFLDTRSVPPPPERGGLPRRMYRLSGLGERALQASELMDVGDMIPEPA